MKRKLKTISGKLKKASKAHASQAKQIDDIMKKQSALKLKKSPALKKLSEGCKAAARAKFDVYPSAYANIWASKQQKKGKC